MYTFGSAISRQGAITIPRTPVIRPPVRKLISLGRAFEKSYEGLTMLAATLTDRVATASVKSAKTTTSGLSNFPVSVTGSQMGAPYTFCVAAVISTATRGKTVMVVGRPTTWPSAWARWLLPSRVDSGIESAAANPRLDPEPPARDACPEEGRDVCAEDTERRPGEDRVGDAVLRAGVAICQHWNQDDDVGQRDRQDRLVPGHAERDEAGCQQIRRDVVGHSDPERHVVIGRPGAVFDRHRRQVGVVERAVANRGIVGQLVPAVRIDELLPDSLRRRCVGRYSHVPLLEFAVAVFAS